MLFFALRNFWRHRQQFVVLLVLVTLGTSLSLVLLAATESLTQTLKAKATQYFGGDLSVLGYANDGSHRVSNEPEVLSTLQDSKIPFQRIFRRTVSYNSETILFFKDHSIKQRRMIGIDVQKEGESLRDLDLESDIQSQLTAGSGILLSRGTADKLRAEVGDEVTLLLDTLKGSKNTVTLTVTGIFHDTSFFGYSSYLNIEVLNQALGYPPGSCTELGISLPPGVDVDKVASNLQESLSHWLTVLPLLRTKSDLDSLQSDSNGLGDRYAVMTLGARIGQIQQILDAVLTVSVVLNVLFLAIVVMGVGNTFRAVLVERTREIGVWRALGMLRLRLIGLILAEVTILVICGWVLGAFLGTLAWTALTGVDWGSQALAAMFLVRGHLVWVFPGFPVAIFFFLLVLTGVVGALSPSIRAAYWKPVEALRYHQ